MKKPNAKAYGLDNELWEKGGKKAYETAYLKWAEYRQKYGINSGRARTRPIHESWNDVLQLFDSSNPQRSQGAFCRWAGIDRAAFSGKHKQLSEELEAYILAWVKSWDEPKLDFPINCPLCEKELVNEGEVFFSREMLYINQSFVLVEEPNCKECHELNQNGDFGIMPQFKSEYERLMEKD